VTDKGKIPQNWRSFLRDNSIKTELFNFLADKIVKMCPNNTGIVTQEEGVVCNQSISLEGLTHCNHEEADTRMFKSTRSPSLNWQDMKSEENRRQSSFKIFPLNHPRLVWLLVKEICLVLLEWLIK
jgi:hypothetical protein